MCLPQLGTSPLGVRMPSHANDEMNQSAIETLLHAKLCLYFSDVYRTVTSSAHHFTYAGFTFSFAPLQTYTKPPHLLRSSSVPLQHYSALGSYRYFAPAAFHPDQTP